MFVKMNKLIIGMVLVCISSTAHAGLINYVDNGNYTSDTVSGFDWLDITESAGMSYNTVSGNFAAGGLFEGWRYASSVELGAFLQHVAVMTDTITGPGDTGTFSDPNDLSVLLSTLLGVTFTSETRSNGILGDVLNVNYRPLADIGVLPGVVSTGGMYYVNASTPGIGSWLVRDTDTVPEPTSIALLAVGLAGLARSRRKKRIS